MGFGLLWAYFDAIVVFNHLLEFVSNEFITSVIGDLDKPRILDKTFLLCNIDYGDGSFVIIWVLETISSTRVIVRLIMNLF